MENKKEKKQQATEERVEEKELTLDDIENAPEDLEELFSEPPTLDLDSDEEPTDEDLKLEEMDMDKLNEVARILFTEEKISGEDFRAIMEAKTE